MCTTVTHILRYVAAVLFIFSFFSFWVVACCVTRFILYIPAQLTGDTWTEYWHTRTETNGKRISSPTIYVVEGAVVQTRRPAFIQEAQQMISIQNGVGEGPAVAVDSTARLYLCNHRAVKLSPLYITVYRDI